MTFLEATEVVYKSFDGQYIFYNGLVVPDSGVVNVKLTCNIRVRLFPFDTQVLFSLFIFFLF